MSCRDMLRSLDKAGKIVLPPKIGGTRKPGTSIKIEHLKHDETPINCSLNELQPLHIKIVSKKDDLTEFKSYLDQYHYLGFGRFIGERMAYMIYNSSGKTLACLLFGAAAWSCKDRDQFIGWNKEQRKHRLNQMTNNSRFLIFPWVKVPHLASHILSIISKRISSDWEDKYGHPICCLETFVEIDRFKGTCYKAGNWLNVGRTTGRGRNGGHHRAIVPYKDIYLYPLSKNWRITLCEGMTDKGVQG